MRNVNSVVIDGNLTRDAELRTTAGGTDVLGFGVAFNTAHRSAESGEWEEAANFVDCAIFGPRAAALAPFMTKGRRVLVQGELRYSAWEAKDGSGRRSKLEISVDRLELVGRGGDGESAEAACGGPVEAAPLLDEDIPF